MRVGSFQVNLSLTPTEYNFAMPSVLEVGDTIGWIPGNHEADKQMAVTADIAFGEPEIFQGRPMIETLTELVKYVQDRRHTFRRHSGTLTPPSRSFITMKVL